MLIESIDFFRLDAARKLNAERRAELGQFMTPPATAKLMAAMFEAKGAELNLLDPGAGVGSLTAAFVSEVSKRDPKPRSIHVTAYEIDATLCEYLSGAPKQCGQTCDSAGIKFTHDILNADFIDSGASLLRNHMFSPVRNYSCVKSMLKYLDQISWETEVWVAESPLHLIHFNGERFLGPYPE